MTPEEREKMNELCQRIQVEKDQDTLNQLCRELNDFLESKPERVPTERKTA